MGYIHIHTYTHVHRQIDIQKEKANVTKNFKLLNLGGRYYRCSLYDSFNLPACFYVFKRKITRKRYCIYEIKTLL